MDDERLFPGTPHGHNELEYLASHFSPETSGGTVLRLSILDLLVAPRDKVPPILQKIDEFCETLLESRSPPRIFRVLDVQLTITQYLTKPLISTSATSRLQKCKALQQELERLGCESPRTKFQLEVLDFEHNHDSDPKKHAEGYLVLAEKAGKIGDLARKRQNLIAAETIMRKMAGTQAADAFLRNIRTTRLRFEGEVTFSTYFHWFALNQFAIPMIQGGMSADFLNYVRQVQKAYPDFDVPLIKAGLYGSAAMASQSNNLSDSKHYTQLKEQAWKNCPWAERREDSWYTLTDSARTSGDHYQREVVSADGEQMMFNEVRLLLHWTKSAFVKNRISADEVKKMFDLKVDKLLEFPTPGSYDLLSTKQHPTTIRVAQFLHGTEKKVVGASEWDARLDLIEPLLTERFETTFKETRHWLLKRLQLSRRYRLRLMRQAPGKQQMDDIFYWLYKANMRYIRILGDIVPAARGLNEETEGKQAYFESMINLARSPTAIGLGLVDNELIQRMIGPLGEELCEKHLRNGNLGNAYYAYRARARAAANGFNLLRFLPGPISPDAGQPFLEAADEIYCQLRRNAASLQLKKHYSAKAFADSLQVVNSLEHHETYRSALLSCRSTYRALVGNTPGSDHETAMKDLATSFVLWTERAKSRTILDGLGLTAQLPTRLIESMSTVEGVARLLEYERSVKSRLSIAEKRASQADQMELRLELDKIQDEMRASSAFAEVMAVRDGTPVRPKEIQELLKKFDDDTIIISFIEIGVAATLWRLCFARNQEPEIFETGVSLEQVKPWLGVFLTCTEPLSEPQSLDCVQLLEPLIRGLGDLSKPGSKLIFCPTQALHRVPLHLLQINGEMLVDRNQVVYCPSLSILQRSHSLVTEQVGKQANDEYPPAKASILCPHDSTWTTPGVFDRVSELLGVEAVRKPWISQAKAKFAINDASLFHFQGHGGLHQTDGMKQHLEIGEMVTDGTRTTEKLRAEDIFNLSLRPAAFVNLVACQSGHSQINEANDLLGLSTAFFCAGATAVVSTMWKIRAEDGLLFSDIFYQELAAEVGRASANKKTEVVDIARVLHDTLYKMRERCGEDGKPSTPYRWAAFTLNGYWEVPASGIPCKLLPTDSAELAAGDSKKPGIETRAKLDDAEG